MIHVGFTGTRHGMSPAQIEAVIMVVQRIAATGRQLVAHHGDCVGADEDFHEIARNYGDAIVETHPGPEPRMRARCAADHEHPPEPFLRRNRRIVGMCVAMIATPFERSHQDHGGTWYTVDLAMKLERPLALVLPRGRGATIEFSGGWAWPELPKEMTR